MKSNFTKEIPVLKREFYMGGRNARKLGRTAAPAELRGPDLQWWMKGWSDCDREMEPEGFVSREQAIAIQKDIEKADRQTAKEKTRIRRSIDDILESRRLKKINSQVWEDL